MRPRVALAALLAAPLAAVAWLPPRYGGELRVVLPELPADLDPAHASTPAQLFLARCLHAAPLEIDAAGGLRPGLLGELPEPEPGGRAFLLRLRPGLHFQDGRAVSTDDLAASLARLLRPATGSPHAWLALAIQGAEAVRQGRAAALSGIQVLSGLELRVVLDAPFDLPRALAAAPAAVLSPGGAGAGPFGPAGRAQGSLRLAPFERHHGGRPYADTLVISALDARRAARALLRAEADLLLRPEAAQGGASRELPALTASYALVNPRRLGPLAGAVRRTLADLDRGELTRLFVRGPAVPLQGPLPPAIAESPPEAPGRPDGPLRGAPVRLTLLASSSPDLHRAVADRIQVKLFDRGLRVGVEVAEPAAFSARMAAGDWDLALVAVTFVSASPGLAAIQLAYALGGAPLAARALSRLGSAEPSAIAAEAVEAADAVPLFASGLRATARAGLEGLSPRPDGLPDPGGLWSLAARPAR